MYGKAEFEDTLKADLLQNRSALPLAQCTLSGGMIDDSELAVSILSCNETGSLIQGNIAVFFTEIVICCGCGDDPQPQSVNGLMQFELDKRSADIRFTVIED